MVTQQMIEALIALPDDGLPVVSLYLDLDGGAPARESGHVTRAEAMARAAEGGTARDDVARVVRFVRDEFARRDHRGLAVFASVPRALWQVHPLGCRVRDRLVVDRRAYVRPLAQLREESPPCALALVDREKGHFFVVEQGELLRACEVTGDVPGRVRPGSWYGLADRRIERHVDECIHRHLKSLAAVLDEMVRREPRTLALIGGPPDVLPEFERTLPRRVRERLAGTVPNPLKPTPAAALGLVRDALRAAHRSQGNALVGRLREGAGPAGFAVGGFGATVDALYRDAVQTLAVGRDRSAPGFLCARCGRLAPATSGPGGSRASASAAACPVCGRGDAVSPVPDLFDEMVDAALREGADVVYVDDSPEWEHVSEGEGTAALLRFRPAAWETIPDGHPAAAAA